MEKRIVTFALVSFAIMLSFHQLQLMIFGRPEPVADVAMDEGVGAAGPNAPNGKSPDATASATGTSGASEGVVGEGQPPSADSESGDSELGDSELGEGETDGEPDAEGANDPLATVEPPHRFVTLGSLNQADGYRILVTLNSKGATVERIELANPRYRDLHDKSGYLGHLLATDERTGGVRVGVVGAGTPAALATSPGQPNGLQAATFKADEKGVVTVDQPGDVIIGLNGQPLSSCVELELLLAKTRPGETIEIDVQRGEERMVFTTTLAKRPLEVIKPEPLGPDEDVAQPLSFLATFARVGDRAIALGDDELNGLDLYHGNWSTTYVEAEHAVVFSRRLSRVEVEAIGATGSLELVKRFRLPPTATEANETDDATGYLLEMDLEIRNLGDQPQLVSYQLDGPTGLPLEGWWYSNKTHPRKWSGAGARDIVWRPATSKMYLKSCGEITNRAADDPKNPDTLLIDSPDPVAIQYIGADTQYFSAVLMPRHLAVADPDATTSSLLLDAAVARAVGPLDEERKKRTNVSFRLRSNPVSVEPGKPFTQEFAIFAGPKERHVLSQFGLGECIVYGYFGAVSKPLVGILHFLYGIFRNYGIAIVLLTVGVRGLMFPFGRKMAQNAQKMQELAPEMKKLTEKYKNDLEKRSKAQRELFAKHNYNPLAGCPMMFLQLPVFIGLYRGLGTDIQLRQAPLIPGLEWCANLAGPDMLLDWSSWLPPVLSARTGWLGPYMNVLPFITCFLFILHQKLFTPPPQDEQQQLQQSMMKVMMLFMGVMFHKVAAGLCIYFISSSLWGLGERLLLPKPKLATSAAGGGDTGGGTASDDSLGGAKPDGGGQGGTIARLLGRESNKDANGSVETKKKRKKHAKTRAKKKR